MPFAQILIGLIIHGWSLMLYIYEDKILSLSSNTIKDKIILSWINRGYKKLYMKYAFLHKQEPEISQNNTWQIYD